MTVETEPAQTGKPREVVGLMGDPGLPFDRAEQLSSGLSSFLEEHVDNGTDWIVETERSSLPLDGNGTVQLSVNSAELRERRGWDFLVYITDLPKYQLNEPLVSTSNTTYRSAMIVLPSLGFSGTRRLRRILLQAVRVLHAGATVPPDHVPGPPASAGSGSTHDEGMDTKGSEDTVETAKGLMGRLGMLVGMVRSNRPMRLLPQLSSSIAAAIAAGAFGIFYTSIWNMADFLSPVRLLLISVLSVSVMTVWLGASHGLYEWPGGAHRIERRFTYNAATAVTVLSAVCMMYVLLFALILAGGLVVIDAQYLGQQLGKPATMGNYVSLAWLSASLGTIAGAVGSTLTDAEVVRKATFSNREYERRQITMEAMNGSGGRQEPI